MLFALDHVASRPVFLMGDVQRHEDVNSLHISFKTPVADLFLKRKQISTCVNGRMVGFWKSHLPRGGPAEGQPSAKAWDSSVVTGVPALYVAVSSMQGRPEQHSVSSEEASRKGCGNTRGWIFSRSA